MAAAYAALVSLMNVIHDLQDHPPSISLDDLSLQPIITQHIIFFLDFLHAYSPAPVSNDDEESADPLEMRIANAACAAEDLIESHIVDTIHSLKNPQQFFRSEHIHLPSWIRSNDARSQSMNLYRDRLRTMIKDMDLIKNLVFDTKEKKKKMVAVHDQVLMKNVLAPVSREETTVGLDAASREIMEKLTGVLSNLQIIPIVGMGGIGKTFLANSIYEKPLIKDHFDICAWATISQQYNAKEILSEILSQATKQNKEGLSVKREDELGLELMKFLFGRRFLIVLDDIWSVDAWDKIQRFFPNNENGSRVMVTTRLSHLSSQLNRNYSLPMSFLDKATGWDLFSKTVFGDKGSCPLELKEIGKQIVDNCRGLPLSIVVVGGLVKKSDGTLASWKSIRDNMSSMVNMENDNHCLKLLKLSYNHLPIYLKPCFLYMGVFKEDYKIRVSVLIKLWVSEGFLKPSYDGAMETTAREFLQELIDRNLILIHSMGRTGKIKYCKIHDLVRDLCLKESQNGGLYHVVGKCNQHPREMNTLRRVIIPMDTSKENARDYQLRSMLNARSVICEYWDCDVPQNLRLLRTFHTNKIYHMLEPHWHVNLRHVDIKVDNWDMSSFLHSVSLLWNLQTLIVSGWQRTTFPSDFWKIPQIRHIKFVGDSIVRLPNTPSDEYNGEFIIMDNLHTLGEVSNFKCCEGMVKRIPNIKKLRLLYFGEPGDEYFVENIRYLCRLESLFVGEEEFSNICNMQKLRFPQSLKKLRLSMNNDFEWQDIMELIGLLPLLEKLEIRGGCFRKGKWETVEDQFPCLKYLELKSCEDLENWTAIEEGSNILTRLEHLRLEEIEKLKKIPLELGNIDTLKKIELIWCGEEAVKCVKEMVDEQVESQGEGCFHVLVTVFEETEYQSLKSLAGPHFEVSISPNVSYPNRFTRKKVISSRGLVG